MHVIDFATNKLVKRTIPDKYKNDIGYYLLSRGVEIPNPAFARKTAVNKKPKTKYFTHCLVSNTHTKQRNRSQDVIKPKNKLI